MHDFFGMDAFLPEANVMPNLSMGHSLDDLQELSQSFSPTRQIRCYAGYAGWSGGQIEGELKRKAWLVHPASIELVFCSEPGSLWKTILKGKGGKDRLLAESPEDISFN